MENCKTYSDIDTLVADARKEDKRHYMSKIVLFDVPVKTPKYTTTFTYFTNIMTLVACSMGLPINPERMTKQLRHAILRQKIKLCTR